MFTKTEEIIIAKHDPKINQAIFSIPGGKMSHLKAKLVIDKIAPMVTKNRRKTASEAVMYSNFRLSTH